MRAVDLNGLSALRYQLVNRRAVRFHHAWLPAIALKLLNQANLNARQVTLCAFARSSNNICHWTVNGGRIKFIVACDNLMQ